jgi:hypothetical protein
MSAMQNTINRPGTPTPYTFRAWLQEALLVIDTSPTTLAKAINKSSPNAVGTFLRDKDRDITLSTAAKIERMVVKIASVQGKALPKVPRALTASPGRANA